jgi:hypothetical protein
MHCTRPAVASVALAILALASSAQASFLYGFDRITSNAHTDIAPQLQMELLDQGGYVTLRFTDSVGTASSITQIYVDNTNSGHTPVVLSGWYTTPILDHSGFGLVDFKQGASPSNLPAAPKSFDADFSASANNGSGGTVNHGVNMSGEWVDLNFKLLAGKTANDVATAINNGSLQIGLHVQGIQSCQGDASDSFIIKPGPQHEVPEPGSLLLLGGGLGAIALKRPRR